MASRGEYLKRLGLSPSEADAIDRGTPPSWSIGQAVSSTAQAMRELSVEFSQRADRLDGFAARLDD